MPSKKTSSSKTSKNSKPVEVVEEAGLTRDQVKAAVTETNELLGFEADSEDRIRVVKSDTAETLSEKIANAFRAVAEDEDRELPELDNVSDELLTVLNDTGVINDLFEEVEDEEEEEESDEAEDEEEESEDEDADDDEEDEGAEESEDDEDGEEEDDADEDESEDDEEVEDEEDEEEEDEEEDEPVVSAPKKSAKSAPAPVKIASPVKAASIDAVLISLPEKLDEIAERIERAVASMVEEFKSAKSGRFSEVDVAPRKTKSAPVEAPVAKKAAVPAPAVKKTKLTAEQKAAISEAREKAEEIAKQRMGRSGDLRSEDERRAFVVDNAKKMKYTGKASDLTSRTMFKMIRDHFVESAERKTRKRLGLDA